MARPHDMVDMLCVSGRTIEWMVAGEPWVVHSYRSQVLGMPMNREAVRSTAESPRVRSLAVEVSSFPWGPLTSHKASSHPIHKLTFLADLGLPAEDLGIAGAVESILENMDTDGVPRVPMIISKEREGSERLSWALCDAPLMLYSLAKLGYRDDERVRRGTDHLMSLCRPNGWPCAVAGNLGKFRGPGRKDDPCPFANMVMLKLLAQIPDVNGSEEVRMGAETALGLWANSRERNPYMFFMGTDFRKLKAPMVWYDILHLVDVLSQYPDLREDERLKEMVDLMCSKAVEGGQFVPESVWLPWKDWDLGQKKAPSRGLTMMVHRALSRMSLLRIGE